MSSISEKLEDYFFNNIDPCDHKFIDLLSLDTEDWFEKYKADKLINLLSLSTEECEEKYREKPQLFDEYFLNTTLIEGPEIESDSDIEINNVNTNGVKIKDISEICYLNDFTCSNEKNLFEIPYIAEHHLWFTVNLMKLPVIGNQCTERWHLDANSDLSKASLGLTTRIAKDEITKICDARFKQQKLKNFSLSYCKAIGDFQKFKYREKSSDCKEKVFKKKNSKTSWKTKKRFSPGKYSKKKSSKVFHKKPPDKNCLQGKKKCRCWICNEGH